MWFLRFSLGLPARKGDIQALRKDLPELFSSNNLEPTTKYLSFQASCFGNLSKVEFWNALQQWISDYNNQEKDKIDLPKPAQNVQNCPAEICPLRENQPDYNTLFSNKNKSEQQDSTKNFQNAILEVMYVGGEKDCNLPLNKFLALVKECHKNRDSSKIKEVIVTDPYVLKPVGDRGVGGGYDNFIKYLSTLGLDNNSQFGLKFNGGGCIEKRQILERTLKEKFLSVSIEYLSPKLDFHDRFYLVRYKNGDLKGLFGPSLNGLSAKSIVLIGELEENALKWLGQRI